jgi:hypothetical protein
MLALPLMIAALATGCATSSPRAERFVDPPVGTVTVYHRQSSGSFGTVDGPVTWRVARAEWQGQPVNASASPQAGTQFYDPATHGMVAVLNPAGQPMTAYAPPIGPRWPMQVGDQWRTTHEVTLYPSMRKTTVDVNWKVEAHETITVPAGAFKAFRITTTSSVGETETVWTAPELGLGVIKRQTVRSASHPQGAGELRGELLSRTLP